MGLRAVKDNVVIEPIESDERSQGGIIITPSKGTPKGKVVSVGNAVGSLGTGDIVYYDNKYAVSINGFDVVKYEDVKVVEE